MGYKWTDEQLYEACQMSTSIRQVLSCLGLKEAGGNYTHITASIKELDIDISHFTGKGWNAGKTFGPKREIAYYLVEGSTILSHTLKLRLFKEGIKERICESCKLTEWLGKPMPLELNHLNGKHKDNRLENLQILCPNCHAQTSNYRGKNIGKAG